MTTFVDTSVLLGDEQAARDQDPVVVVVRSAQTMLREGLGESESATFESSFTEAYDKSEWSRIIDLLLGNSQVVFNKVASADDVDKVSKTAEGYFEVTLSLLSKLETVEDVVAKITAFIGTMKGEESSPAVQALKLKLLTTLFATLNPKAQLRLLIAKGLCRFASSDLPKLAAPVYTLVKECDKWLSEFDWDLSNEEKCEVYGLVAAVAPTGGDKLKYLSLQASIAPETEKSRLNQQLAVETIRDPVAATSISASDKTTVECLEILSKGSFSDMESFVGSNESFLVKNGIDKSTLLDKMRILALGRLARGKRTVPIAEIGTSLKASSPEDVIVKTIRAGVIMGSIDEVEGVLRIVAVKSSDSSLVSADLKKVVGRL